MLWLHKLAQNCLSLAHALSQPHLCLSPSASTTSTTIRIHHPLSKFLFSFLFYTHACPPPASTTIHVCTPTHQHTTHQHTTCQHTTHPQAHMSTTCINKVGSFFLLFLLCSSTSARNTSTSIHQCGHPHAHASAHTSLVIP